MKIIRAANELGNADRKVCLAIGVFDGVHLGHHQIIRQTVADARQHDALAVVVTFDRHPSAIVAPERQPPQIYSHTQKMRVIESLGVDAFLEIPFDKSFSEKSGDEFIRELAQGFGEIHSICVGADFVFGYQRSGNVALLRMIGTKMLIQVHGLAAVVLDGVIVSSTRIRQAIRSGDLDTASQMLGRPYAICGHVVEGDKIGRQLGFPTANLSVVDLALPPRGIYAARTSLGHMSYRTALNIGLRPSVAIGISEIRVEAHLLEFNGDLYGTDLEVEVGVKLRDEMQFASLGELKKQIARDVESVRAME